jgi:hypothetical protein
MIRKVVNNDNQKLEVDIFYNEIGRRLIKVLMILLLSEKFMIMTINLNNLTIVIIVYY